MHQTGLSLQQGDTNIFLNWCYEQRNQKKRDVSLPFDEVGRKPTKILMHRNTPNQPRVLLMGDVLRAGQGSALASGSF